MERLKSWLAVIIVVIIIIIIIIDILFFIEVRGYLKRENKNYGMDYTV